MVTILYEVPDRWGKTLKAYMILVHLASDRQTIRYGQLGDEIDEIAVNVGDPHLNRIEAYCVQNRLPNLVTLVVNQTTGQPGEGIELETGDIYKEREEVYDFNWLDIAPPTIEDLMYAWGKC